MEAFGLNVYYGDFHAVHDVNLQFGKNEITALIGPSGCGKSTVLRCLNRMNDLVAGARVEGEVSYHGQNIYARGVDPIAVRTQIGMVFQKPNPFPKSIYDNIAYGPRVTGMKVDNMDDLVERGAARAPRCGTRSRTSSSSRRTGSPAVSSSGCASPAPSPPEPDVILMDEPCSALDPIATSRIEDLMVNLRDDYTIIIVTHNMQQAARVSDRTAFFTARPTRPPATAPACWSSSTDTRNIFANPARQAHRGLHLRPLRLSRGRQTGTTRCRTT